MKAWGNYSLITPVLKFMNSQNNSLSPLDIHSYINLFAQFKMKLLYSLNKENVQVHIVFMSGTLLVLYFATIEVAGKLHRFCKYFVYLALRHGNLLLLYKSLDFVPAKFCVGQPRSLQGLKDIISFHREYWIRR